MGPRCLVGKSTVGAEGRSGGDMRRLRAADRPVSRLYWDSKLRALH